MMAKSDHRGDAPNEPYGSRVPPGTVSLEVTEPNPDDREAEHEASDIQSSEFRDDRVSRQAESRCADRCADDISDKKRGPGVRSGRYRSLRKLVDHEAHRDEHDRSHIRHAGIHRTGSWTTSRKSAGAGHGFSKECGRSPAKSATSPVVSSFRLPSTDTASRPRCICRISFVPGRCGSLTRVSDGAITHVQSSRSSDATSRRATLPASVRHRIRVVDGLAQRRRVERQRDAGLASRQLSCLFDRSRARGAPRLIVAVLDQHRSGLAAAEHGGLLSSGDRHAGPPGASESADPGHDPIEPPAIPVRAPTRTWSPK